MNQAAADSGNGHQQMAEASEPELHGKYIQLQNIPSDDDEDSGDYVLEDVSQKLKPISYAKVFNVGANRPPVNYFWLAVVAATVQAVLAPYLYLLEMGCGLNLAHRSLQTCRMSRSYFDRSEYELAALTAFKAGRYAGGSLTLSILMTAVILSAVLAICLAKPEAESTLDFHLTLRSSE